jgi:hypothetical protein
MRTDVLLNETPDPTGLLINYRIALWLAVPPLAQTPLPGFTSQVPVQSGQPSGSTWAVAGITPTELAALQAGTYVEQVVSFPIPQVLFSDAGAAACVNAWYSYYQARVNAAVPPSVANYIGASGNVTTLTAASNGLSLPQATITVASTAAFPSSGAAFVVTTAGMQMVLYTGTTPTSLTGCTQGTGTMATGGNVWSFTAA